MNQVDNKAERSRQREVDIQNKKLLNNIMNIMKRRNQSVQQARRIPNNVIGGTQSSVMSKFGETLFRNSNSILQQDSVFEETNRTPLDRDSSSKLQKATQKDQSSVDYIQSPNYDSVEEEDREILASSLMSKRNHSISMGFEPVNMRGSLNVGYRKHEVLRINNGNRKILDQLRQVKPTVGTLEEWKKHEIK